MKKKILHIVEGFGGGVFTFLVDLINSTSNKYDIILACAIRPQTPKNYREYFNKNVKIIELQNAGREIDTFKDIKLLFEMKKIILNNKPDIIHLHSSKAGFLGRLICNDKKVKILYNPHGFAFLKQDESKFKRTLYKMLEYLAAKKSGCIIGVSKGEYQEALKLSKKSFLVNNGIDIDKLPKIREKLFVNKICIIGRICEQKNPKLFNEIAKNFPEHQFDWIGDGELRGVLSSKNINILGWKEKNEALSILRESDIFILTSLWEGLPIALLEAMYYKKICIVSNCIGNRDVIIDNYNGFIANNLDEFIDKVKKVLNNEVDINRIKENAYKDIVNIYNFENVVNEYIKLYD